MDDIAVITIRYDTEYGGIVYDLDNLDDFSALGMLDHVRTSIIDNLSPAVTTEELATIGNEEDE